MTTVEPAPASTLQPVSDDEERRPSHRRTNRRRGASARRMIDTTVPSPCIQICQIDKAQKLCTGCKRSIDEIRDWMIMTADEKRSVLAALNDR